MIPRHLALTLLLLPLVGPACSGDDDGCGGARCVSDAGTGDDAGGSIDGGPADAATDAGGGDAGCTTLPCGVGVVDAAWLQAHLMDSDLQTVDVRDVAAWEAGRIPGAAHVDVGEVRATVGGVSGQVAPPATLEAVMGAAGVRDDATLVVYGDTTTTTPARLVWTLRYYGHADAWLLDGGFAAWSAAAGPIDDAPALAPPTLYGTTTVAGLRVDVDWVLSHLDDAGVVLVDARSDAEYARGHIPGARSVNWQRMVDTGAFRPRADVAALYEGIARDATVIAYCQTGSRASVTFVALSWLGFSDVRLYDGSWAEWAGRSDLPRE